MKTITKWIVAGVIAASAMSLTSCGTEWTVRVTKDGIIATPDGPINIPLTPQK